MKKLRKLANKPIIGPWVKKAMDYAVNREVKTVAKHFSNYLTPIEALSNDCRDQAFHIRHDVYCKELKFEEENKDKMESDFFDTYSTHCLIQHLPTSNFAGTVRVVRPQKAGEIIPIQKYCLNSISPGKINPNDYQPHEICEISRLAVPSEFRKRQTDKFKGAATGVINQEVYSENELRCFPFIAVGLYLSAASIVIENGIKHTFVMMEPRLARSMRFVGIQFEQIGPTVDYHGKRAPYYINPSLLMQNLTPGFQLMLQGIRKSLNHSVKTQQK
ncbi:PEP-CTERM/exosortase system-associated acyltransferase [Paraglaciecola sp.]|uniref:PEP-CTERM/exosortase system-associated acyltransferase n=1 Tax=Paraglaciecola sp. TaxID=1920173 RepID=UPI003EF8FDC2